MGFQGRDIISVKPFTREHLETIFKVANACEPYASGEKRTDVLRGKVLGNLFFEASTRTRLSFGSAFRRLGGAVETTVGVSFSSISKGETLEDTIRVIDGYVDVIVLRHPQLGSAKIAADYAKHPVINGGDGPGEHPTQALLDLYTIQKERGQIDGSTVAFVGDLKYGRTVHSLVELLTRFEGIRVVLASPDALRLPPKLLASLRERGLHVEETSDLTHAARQADVMYVTRLQAERFPDPAEAAKLIGAYVVDRALLEVAKPDVSILHPLPRHGDLSEDVDDHPGAAYFRQAHNGIPVRMALFALILGKEETFLEGQ
ncbi:MAG: aspartate carbamoyltransferase [Myxococcales bacterium]|nr:aspartate carbamoyltransferase [Myxococcales bacterium]